MQEKGQQIWVDGTFFPWEEARVHVLSHALHYGTAYFEGLRCYLLEDDRSAVFRMGDHVRRFIDSGLILGLPMSYLPAEVEDAILDTVRTNRFRECYIRPVAFVGEGEMGLYAPENPLHVAIAAWRWGAYLGEEGMKHGIRAKVSSFSRHHVNAMMTKAKVSGNYINSVMAKYEVKKAGYDEAVMLDPDGYVSEASGENIFIVRDGSIKTTPLMSVLPGITRHSVIAIARDQHIEVKEERFPRDELYSADEAFLTGTAAELTPIREVDDRPVGGECPGPITKELQRIFFNVIKGKEPRYEKWLTYL
jgi:branched-chain amino acid aminotransferase